MNPRRCGFGVPLDQLPDGDRQIVEDFRRYLRGELALAADGITYVQPGDERAVHRVPPLGKEEGR
ncbi:hypothetical protein ABT369_39340 [Dactylosporangium sp. NPDC000244]|uniref:hypothetical protein n=1 Tax=Dactylosporangium sp. NPDC000244 TaxID=3154365 RepID=UPI003326F19D